MATEAFWTGIREYYRRYRDRNASTDELRQVMEQVSEKDRLVLRSVASRPGLPRVEGTWRYDADAQMVDVTLTQTHPGEPFTFPLDVAVMGAMSETPVTTRLTVD